MAKYLDDNGLLYYDGKIKTRLSNKVDKEAGKGLFSGSYNDLTDKPTIPTVNDATLTIQKNSTTVDTFTANASSNKTINITVPTTTSDLTNNSDFQTSTEVQTLIDASIAGITGIDFQIVTSLPSTGEKGVIYLISNSGTGTNIYDEYIWISGTPGRYEKIGSTDVDLSNYWSKTELTTITNADIDTIVNGQSNS